MPVYCVFSRGIESGEDTLEVVFQKRTQAVKYVYDGWIHYWSNMYTFNEFMQKSYLYIEIWECGKPYSGKYLPLRED